MEFETRNVDYNRSGDLIETTETHVVPDEEIENLLVMAMAGTLESVDGDVIRTEIERRSLKE